MGYILYSFLQQQYLLFVFASVIALYAAWPFYRGALKEEIPSGNWGMMTLVSLAVLAGYLYSAATTFVIEAPGFYWEIATLVLVLLFGHWMEMRAVRGASGALRRLWLAQHRSRRDLEGFRRDAGVTRALGGWRGKESRRGFPSAHRKKDANDRPAKPSVYSRPAPRARRLREARRHLSRRARERRVAPVGCFGGAAGEAGGEANQEALRVSVTSLYSDFAIERSGP